MVCLLGLVLAERAVRNLPLAALCAYPFLSERMAAKDWGTQAWGTPALHRARITAGIALVLACAALIIPVQGRAGLYYAWITRDGRCFGWDADTRLQPAAAASFVLAHHLPGPIYNDLDSGGYLIWRFQGHPARRQVFIDGRLEVVPRELLARWATASGLEVHRARAQGDPVDERQALRAAWSAWQALQAEFGFRTLIIGRQMATIPLPSGDPQWRLEYVEATATGEVARVYVRR
jgi:hypothetical protein